MTKVAAINASEVLQNRQNPRQDHHRHNRKSRMRGKRKNKLLINCSVEGGCNRCADREIKGCFEKIVARHSNSTNGFSSDTCARVTRLCIGERCNSERGPLLEAGFSLSLPQNRVRVKKTNREANEHRDEIADSEAQPRI